MLLLVDPLLVHRAAFQLSVAASAGILVGARPLADVIPGSRILSEASSITLAAQAAVAPLLLVLFGPVPVAALPANLLAAPVAGPLMVWGLTGGLVAGAFGPPLDSLVHLPTGVGLRWIAGVAEWTGRCPLGLLGAPSAVAVSVLVASTAALSNHGRIREARLLLASTLVALAVVGAVHAFRPPPTAHRPPPTAHRPPPTGIADGIRLLDGGGSAVVVEHQISSRRLLESLRTRGVHSPVLIVFREPVSPWVRESPWHWSNASVHTGAWVHRAR